MLHGQLRFYVNEFLPEFISAYRKGHSTNHVLIRLIENWIRPLDNNLVNGTVLMELSKFDRIVHDLLIGRLHAYIRKILRNRKKRENIYTLFFISNTYKQRHAEIG